MPNKFRWYDRSLYVYKALPLPEAGLKVNKMGGSSISVRKHGGSWRAAWSTALAAAGWEARTMANYSYTYMYYQGIRIYYNIPEHPRSGCRVRCGLANAWPHEACRGQVRMLIHVVFPSSSSSEASENFGCSSCWG